MHKLIATALCLLLSACTASGGTAVSPSSGAGPAAGAPMPGASSAPAASGQVFTIDGQPSTSSDKIAVDTFKPTKVALNFGVQLLAAPTDYTLLLTFNLDAGQTGSGAYDQAAVNQVEALLRDAKTGTVAKAVWWKSKPDGSTFTLSVKDSRITANWKGTIGGKVVEAAVVDLPATKK